MSVIDHRYVPPSINLSHYALSLDNVSKLRYFEKLTFNDTMGGVFYIPDPYNIPKDYWNNDPTEWPSLQYPDLFNFLTTKPREYTSSELKNYKSLAAYEYVTSGKVQTIMSYLPNVLDLVVLAADVAPSQRTAEELFKPWVILRQSAVIESAHCTCMAGLGESCSHITALLFKMELAVRIGEMNIGSTERLCQWNSSFSEKIEAIPMRCINFEAANWQAKKRKRNPVVLPVPNIEIDEQSFLSRLKVIDGNAAIFSVLTDSGTDSATEETEPLPSSMMEIVSLMTSGEDEKTFILSFFNEENCEVLERSTVKQCESELWFKHRSGRLTSSDFGKIVKRRHKTELFCQSLMDPIIQTAAMKWGTKKEEFALAAYLQLSRLSHNDFQLKKGGLFVDPRIPHLGSTPDGIIQCSCHPGMIGVVEVKCPFTHRNKAPKDIPGIDKNFCLTKDLTLKEIHNYFYQIQGQMALCKASYCDFVVWTPVDMLVYRVEKDNAFWAHCEETLTSFFYDTFLPYLKKRSDSENK